MTDDQVDEKVAEYKSKYEIKTDNMDAVKYQAKIGIAMDQMHKSGGFSAYTDSFEDLFGLDQLPSPALQNLMGKGIGFGAEDDWKQAALQAIISALSQGLTKSYSFIEDYTYHFENGNEAVLGAHMLDFF